MNRAHSASSTKEQTSLRIGTLNLQAVSTGRNCKYPVPTFPVLRRPSYDLVMLQQTCKSLPGPAMPCPLPQKMRYPSSITQSKVHCRCVGPKRYAPLAKGPGDWSPLSSCESLAWEKRGDFSGRVSEGTHQGHPQELTQDQIRPWKAQGKEQSNDI